MDQIQTALAAIKAVYIVFFIQIYANATSFTILYLFGMLWNAGYVVLHIMNMKLKKTIIPYILHSISFCGFILIVINMIWSTDDDFKWILYSYIGWYVLEFGFIVVNEIYDIVIFKIKTRELPSPAVVPDPSPAYNHELFIEENFEMDALPSYGEPIIVEPAPRYSVDVSSSS
jgi:hypothetical protein